MKQLAAKIFLRLVLLALLGSGFWLWFALSPVRHAPGVLIKSDPIQINVTSSSNPAPLPSIAGFTLTRLADYHFHGRVLSVKRYHDANASLVPIDVAVGWGPMSDSAVLSKLSISQGNRFYFYEWQGQPPIPKEEIIAHSANVHIIPANREIASMLGRLKTGHLIDFKGVLVEAKKGPFVWRSSLKREDSGPGACELLYLTKAGLFSGNQDLAKEESREQLQETHADLRRWYETLQKRRETLDFKDPQAVREYNLEAQRYMAAAHPESLATPTPTPIPTASATIPIAKKEARGR